MARLCTEQLDAPTSRVPEARESRCYRARPPRVPSASGVRSRTSASIGVRPRTSTCVDEVHLHLRDVSHNTPRGAGGRTCSAPSGRPASGRDQSRRAAVPRPAVSPMSSGYALLPERRQVAALDSTVGSYMKTIAEVHRTRQDLRDALRSLRCARRLRQELQRDCRNCGGDGYLRTAPGPCPACDGLGREPVRGGSPG